MIGKCLDALKGDVYGYLLRLPELNVTSDTVIHVSPVVKHDGSIAIPDNSLGLTLVNVEEERVVKAQQAVARAAHGHVSQINPEIKLNLYLLLAANFVNYGTGLEYLDGAVRFFQGKSVFTPQNTPSLPAGAEKLLLELYSLTFEQQNHLWGSLGAKYLPSVLYRARLIAVQEEQRFEEQPAIGEIGINQGVAL